MKKSILSLVVAVMLVIMMLTSSAYAANEDVTLDKVKEDVCKIDLGGYGNVTKKLVSVDNDNKTVTLEVNVENNKEEEEIIEPSEIFLVLDNSKSMTSNSLQVGTDTITRKDAVFNAAKALAEEILTEQTSTKIGVVRFSTNLDDSKQGTLEDANLVLTPSSNIEEIKSKIDGITMSGDRTDIDAGLKVALNNFSTEQNVNKYLILLTDGVPNTAVGGPILQYSGEVTTKTKASLKAVADKGINIVTVMTGVNSSYMPDADGNTCADAAGKTYKDLATEIFGESSAPNYGKFYYVSDENVTKTITSNVYADVVKKVKNEITDITIEDYFPDNIIENYDIEVTQTTASSATVIAEQPVVDITNKKITWKIQKLSAGKKAGFTYTLKLKEKFNEKIIDLETPTNEKVDAGYKDPKGETKKETSDVSPSVILRKVPEEPKPEEKPENVIDNTVAPDVIPNTGDNSGLMIFAVIALGILVCVGISKYYKLK